MNAITPIAEKQAVRVQIEWTPEMVEILTRLWTEGQSARQIAEQLDGIVTRDAIIGKAYRLKLGKHRRSRAQILADAKLSTRLQRAGEAKSSRAKHGNGGKTNGIIARVALAIENGTKPAPVKSRHLSSDVWAGIPGTTPLSLIDLPADGCKWPVGESPTLFCACTRHGRGPYCETHAGRAYNGFGSGPDGKAGPRHA